MKNEITRFDGCCGFAGKIPFLFPRFKRQKLASMTTADVPPEMVESWFNKRVNNKGALKI